MTKCFKWLYAIDDFSTEQSSCLNRFYRNLKIGIAFWLVLLFIGTLMASIQNTFDISLIYIPAVIYLYFTYLIVVISSSQIFEKANLHSYFTKEDFKRKDNRKVKRFVLFYFISLSIVLTILVLFQNQVSLLLGIKDFQLKPFSFFSSFSLGLYLSLINWLQYKGRYQKFSKEEKEDDFKG